MSYAKDGRAGPRILSTAVMAGVLLALYPVSRWNYLAFHVLVELFTVCVLVAVFVVAWSTRDLSDNRYMLCLGIAAPFVALVIALHMMAYKGMNVFGEIGANLATQLWIISRLLEVLGFIVAGLSLRHKMKPGWVMGGMAAVTVGCLISVFVWPVFPDMFVESTGLTPTKVVLEYVAVAGFVVAIVLLRSERRRFAPQVVNALTASMVLMIAGDLSFTLYSDVYGVMNFLGHFFTALGLFVVLQTVVLTVLRRPFESLFFELKREQEADRRTAETLEYLATRDDLTSLPNRRSFFRELERAIAHAARGADCTLLYLDIDDFKKCNDMHGHEAGDGVLVEVAAAMRGALRDVDVLARVGGDEFGVILWDETTHDAAPVIERLAQEVAEVGRRAGCRIGISVGITSVDPGLDSSALLAIADQRMYSEKRAAKKS